MWVLPAIIALLLPGNALAHSDGLPVGPEDVWHHWTFDPWIVTPMVLAFGLYARGVVRLWASAGLGRGISMPRVASYAAGALVLIVALVSPLDALGDTLLTAHMIQHVLLVAVVPPLLLAGGPGAALPWALPQRTRRAMGRSAGLRLLGRRTAFLLRPLPAAALHGVAMWVWHAPALYEAALRNEAIHTLEHLSFFVTAMLFWQSLVLAARSTATLPAAIAAGFLTMLHGGFLSVLIIFAPRPLYTWYGDRSDLWGLGALADQQLAGLIMGVPTSFVYLFACVALAARFLVPTPPYRMAEQRSPI